MNMTIEQLNRVENDISNTASLRDTEENIGAGGPINIDSILRIPVILQVVVGSATLPVSTLLKLGRGAIVPLDHRIGDPVDVIVNGRVIAKGEVVVVEDDNTRFGVSLTEIKERQLGQK